jgi:hypothetical protein
MNKRCWPIIGLAVCLAVPVFGQTTKTGTISASQTWSGSILVTGDVVVTGSGAVTVSPGTVVKFATTNNNRVNGDASHIYIIIRNSGGFLAQGTAQQPITFTSNAATPAENQWGGFDFESLTRDTAGTDFKYCIFEYDNTAIDFRNVSGSEVSKVNFDHCTFRRGAAAGIYLTSGGASTISYCNFYDRGGPAVFSHPASTLNIKYCIIDSCATGICCASGLNPYSTITINHITFYDIDTRMAGSAQPWNGTAINTTNSSPGGSLNIRNCIVQKTLNFGLNYTTGWTISEDYNCWYNNLPDDITGGNPGGHSLADVDPMMAAPLSSDFRLKTGSPCINKASDGTHIGASQEVVTSGIGAEIPGPADPADRIRVAPNPLADQTAITAPPKAAVAILTLRGQMVRQFVATTGPVVWDGTNGLGQRVATGVYLVRVNYAGQSHQAALMVTAQ